MVSFANISCRMTEQQAAKLRQLASRTGLSKGAVLRALVDSVEVKDVEPVFKSKSAANSFHGASSALAQSIHNSPA